MNRAQYRREQQMADERVDAAIRARQQRADIAAVEAEREMAAPRWGRPAGPGPECFHLWREGFSESECGDENCDGEIEYGAPVDDETCMSCKAIEQEAAHV